MDKIKEELLDTLNEIAKAKSFTTCLYQKKKCTLLEYKASVLNDLCINLGIDTSGLKGTYSIIDITIEKDICSFNQHLIHL